MHEDFSVYFNHNRFRREMVIVDLDGTILPDFTNLDKDIAHVLKEIRKKGHVVCIATGRNFDSSFSIYKKIDLDAVLISYNGAYIVDPSSLLPFSDNEKKYISSFCISNGVAKELLHDDFIKSNLLNLMIDPFPKMISVSSSDDVYYSEVFFNGNDYVKKNDISGVIDYIGGSDCLQIVLEFYNDNKILPRIISTLKKFRIAISFYYGVKLKDGSNYSDKGSKILVPDDSKIIMKLRSSNASKGNAVEIVSKYYNIPLSLVTSFGNDDNDISMTEIISKNGGNGLAVSDSKSDYLKSIASEVTKLSSSEGAVADYLKKKFNIS